MSNKVANAIIKATSIFDAPLLYTVGELLFSKNLLFQLPPPHKIDARHEM